MEPDFSREKRRRNWRENYERKECPLHGIYRKNQVQALAPHWLKIMAFDWLKIP